MKFSFSRIGVIETPFKQIKGMPIQASGAKGILGKIILDKQYEPGLDDLQGFSHIILLYCFHLSKGFDLKTRPFLDHNKRGLFATRAPRRPNPIGISVVRLVKVEENRIHVKDIDVVDGTPLLDIKPYVPAFDIRTPDAVGWLEGRQDKVQTHRSDERFSD